jgi:pimeloyl-ACP methyl ester carboxylesterase
MRLYPQSIVRALLSGVEPLDYGYDMPSHVYAALQRIAFDADRDAGLVPYLPKGGIMAAVRAVRERLDRAPVTVVSRDEKSGTRRIVVLGPGDFELGLVTYAENADRWPAFVLSVYHRHYDAWARDVIEQRKAGMLTLIGPLIDTSLGVTPEREHQLRTDPAVAMLGTWSFAAYLASAADWPTPDVGDAFREPVTTSIPVLFVQGDWDTSTPVENTLNILPGFPNGRAILVHRGQHKGALTLLKHDPMLTAALHTFLKTGDMRDLPTRISVDSPQFARPDFPSVPLSR